MSELRLKSIEFRREREASWKELEDLLELAEKNGLHSMSFQELSRLPILYRSTLSSLSVARAISLDRNLLRYLEGLASRAYVCVYGVRRGLGEAFATFLARRFPQELRAHRAVMLVATVIFLLGVGTGYLMTARDLDAYYRLVPEAVHTGRSPTSSIEELREPLFQQMEVEEGLSFFAAFLFSHNAQIAILCFALGFAVGVPVFYLLFSNAQFLGAMVALYVERGLGVEFLGWLLPHGVTELAAIVICGGAGLAIARAIIVPGDHGRLQALATAGRRASLLVLGAVTMLFIAAGIEGYFRQLVTDTGTRLTIAAFTVVLWGAYFTFAGRRRV